VARSFLRKASERNVIVRLPTDVVVAASLEAEAGRVVQVSDVPTDLMALDVGPETTRAFADEIARARTIFWNGPMGVFEQTPIAQGTLAVAHAIAENRRALSVVGGGDSAAAVAAAGVEARVSHVSTGGGASLEFIQGIKLPGITALEK
jgi:phosphoglycerate kinase